ncbi:hypothetical protein ACIRU8_28255 [Streptomyces sp. NPDC101175]|uniref:hypothetical protein n=1 Tax=Streptomyces sp. NPDC101175 TaxID=3366123 RepID=UPI0038372FEB
MVLEAAMVSRLEELDRRETVALEEIAELSYQIAELTRRLGLARLSGGHDCPKVTALFSRHPDDETGRVGVQTLINRRIRTVWMDLRDTDYHTAVHCHDAGIPVRVQGSLTSPPGGHATMEVDDFGPDPSLT